MTLLDAPPPKQSKIGRYILLGLVILIVGGVAYILLRNYSEERAVSRFLTTVQQGNFQEAYRLWQPSPSYSYQDFLRGWGEQGDYGKIREYKILGSRSQGSHTVVVTVSINNVQPPLNLVVDRRSKGLSYSVF